MLVITDHLPVFQVCTYNDVYNKADTNENRYVYKRCLEEDTIANFVNKIGKVNWDQI